MMTYAGQLRENFYVLGKNFPSNDQILTQVLFALLAREHVFWFSGPGRAKSLMSTSIFGMFDECQALPFPDTNSRLLRPAA